MKTEDARLPHSRESESCVIGSVLMDADMIPVVAEIIPGPHAFYNTRLGAIYRHCVGVHERTGKLDLALLQESCKSDPACHPVGPEDPPLGAVLEECAFSTPTSAHADWHARIVANTHAIRLAANACMETAHRAKSLDPTDDNAVRVYLDELASRTAKYASDTCASEAVSMAESMQREYDKAAKAEGSAPVNIPMTGFPDLDAKLAGLFPGEITIVAARPSMGKTSFMLQVAEQIARGTDVDAGISREGIPVGILSLEMTAVALTHRYLAAHSGVPMSRIRRGKYEGGDYKPMLDTCNSFASVPIFIHDRPNPNLSGVRAASRDIKRRHGIGVLMIDYIGLISAPEVRENRNAEVSAISRGLKDLSRELGIPIVLLSQLNRLAETRTENRPRMADLRDSGSLEQDADNVLLLHREDYYHPEPAWRAQNPNKIGVAEIIVAKNRNGPTDVVKMHWDANSTLFHNHAETNP